MYIEWDTPSTLPTEYKVYRKLNTAGSYGSAIGTIASADVAGSHTNSEGKIFFEDTDNTLLGSTVDYKIEEVGTTTTDVQITNVDIRTIAVCFRSIVMAGTQIYLDWHRANPINFFPDYDIQRKQVTVPPPAPPAQPAPPTALPHYVNVTTIPHGDLKNAAHSVSLAGAADPNPNTYKETAGVSTLLNYYIDTSGGAAGVQKNQTYQYLIKCLKGANIHYVNELTYSIEVKVDNFANADATANYELHFFGLAAMGSGAPPSWNPWIPSANINNISIAVLDPTGNYQWCVIKATLKAVSANKAFYFCADPSFSAADMTSFVDSFTVTNPIYDKDVETFGAIPNFTGSTPPNIITILLMPLQNSGGYAWVYHLKEKTVAGGENSNYRRMLFLITNASLDTIKTNVVHEFQHVIHGCYDNHEKLWLNEGCSMYAQDINDRYRSNEETYLQNFQNNSLIQPLREFAGGNEVWHGDDQYIVANLWTMYLEKRFPITAVAPNNPIAKMVDDPVGTNPKSHDLQHFTRAAPPAKPFGTATYKDLFYDWVITNYFNKYTNSPTPPTQITTISKIAGKTVNDNYKYDRAVLNLFKYFYVKPTNDIVKKLSDFGTNHKIRSSYSSSIPPGVPAAATLSAFDCARARYIRFRCAIPFHIFPGTITRMGVLAPPTNLSDALDKENLTAGEKTTITNHFPNKYPIPITTTTPGHYVCSLEGLDSSNQPRKDVGGTLYIALENITNSDKAFYVEERLESSHAILNSVNVDAGTNKAQITVKNFGEAGTDSQAVTVILPAHETGYEPRYQMWMTLRPKVESVTCSQAAEGTNPEIVYETKDQASDKTVTLTRTNDVTVDIKFDQEMKNTEPDYEIRDGDVIADLAQRYYGSNILTNMISPSTAVVGETRTFKPVIFYTVLEPAGDTNRYPILPSSGLTDTEAPTMANDPDGTVNQHCRVTFNRADPSHIRLKLHICGFGNFADDIMVPEETFLINFPATGSPTLAVDPATPATGT